MFHSCINGRGKRSPQGGKEEISGRKSTRMDNALMMITMREKCLLYLLDFPSFKVIQCSSGANYFCLEIKRSRHGFQFGRIENWKRKKTEGPRLKFKRNSLNVFSHELQLSLAKIVIEQASHQRGRFLFFA